MSLVHKFYISLAILVIASSSCKTSNSDVASIEPGKDILKREGDAGTAIACVAPVTEKHQKIFDANYTEDKAQKPGRISFRPVYKKYFMDTFASIPVGLLNHYFIHQSSYIQLTRGYDELYKKDPKSFAELVIKDQDGRVAALMRGKRDNLGFLEIPTILINLSDDVIAAIDAGPLGSDMEKKMRNQMSILPMAFAVYFAYAATTLLPAENTSPNPVQLNRATYSDVAEAKRQLAFRMLAEMRHEAATNPAIFSDELKGLINNNDLMKPISTDVAAYLDAPEGKSDYQKFLNFHNNGGVREFTNWTLANFMESSICSGDYKDAGNRQYEPAGYAAADAFYKNEMKAQTFEGIIDAEKQYFGENVAQNSNSNGGAGLAAEEINLSKEGPKFKAKEKLRSSAGLNLYLFPRLRNAIFYGLTAIFNVAARAIYVGAVAIGNVAIGAVNVGRYVFGNPVYVNQQVYNDGTMYYGNVSTNVNYNYQPAQQQWYPGRGVVRSVRFIATGDPDQPIFGRCRFGRCR